MITWTDSTEGAPLHDCWVLCVCDVIDGHGHTVSSGKHIRKTRYIGGRYEIEQQIHAGHAYRVTHWSTINRPDGQAWRLTDLAGL